MRLRLKTALSLVALTVLEGCTVITAVLRKDQSMRLRTPARVVRAVCRAITPICVVSSLLVAIPGAAGAAVAPTISGFTALGVDSSAQGRPYIAVFATIDNPQAKEAIFVCGSSTSSFTTKRAATSKPSANCAKAPFIAVLNGDPQSAQFSSLGSIRFVAGSTYWLSYVVQPNSQVKRYQVVAAGTVSIPKQNQALTSLTSAELSQFARSDGSFVAGYTALIDESLLAEYLKYTAHSCVGNVMAYALSNPQYSQAAQDSLSADAVDWVNSVNKGTSAIKGAISYMVASTVETAIEAGTTGELPIPFADIAELFKISSVSDALWTYVGQLQSEITSWLEDGMVETFFGSQFQSFASSFAQSWATIPYDEPGAMWDGLVMGDSAAIFAYNDNESHPYCQGAS